MFPEWLKAERTRLFELAENGQLPHAILIHGPIGTGRRWLALELISHLLAIEWDTQTPALSLGALIDEERAPMHADFKLVQPPPDKRTIPVDRIRELIAFLALTSHQRGYKTALLNPAHAMNRHAANSLLKTLEEPPGDSVIVLVTDSLSRLAPTIVSRCHRIRIALPAPAPALDWLGTQLVGADCARVLELAGGAPLRAHEYHVTGVPERFAAFQADVEALLQRRDSPAGVARRWASADRDLCLSWLYRRISREVIDAQQGSDESNPRTGSLQKPSETLNIEQAVGELRDIGELSRLQGSGLNEELQLCAILTRWCGQR